ncbi:MAG: hypothetical protein ACOCZV_01725, partial [Nanoarchaeota archaeon]
MTSDVSNKTVLILVVLAVVVSTLGTFTVVDAVNQHNNLVPVETGEVSSSDSGKVNIQVAESERVPETTG